AYTSIRSLLDTETLDAAGKQSLILRAMVLAVGSGNFEDGLAFARMSDPTQANSLPLLFLAVDAFKRKDTKAASEYLTQMQGGAVSDFMMPLLSAWLSAAKGDYDVSALTKNPMHYYHAALIANVLGRQQLIEGLLAEALSKPGVQALDLERIADAYTHIGKHDEALKHYKKILEILPDSKSTREKAAKLEAGGKDDFFEDVDGAEQGVARALYDMARVLYQEFSDESALIFGNLALQLDPELVGARILLASISARAERYDAAIAHYRGIGPENQHYENARLQIASLMEVDKRFDEALAELQDLAQNRGNVEAIIQMGDLERRRENFAAAITHYDEAFAKLGSHVPDDHENLYYVRGMAHERAGDWDKAEADLKTALERMPEDPYVLNYLGYAWADKGQHLTKALDMIRRAVAAKPSDGYITDSLGWVYYRMGEYQRALPYLERAVALLPLDPVINDHLGDVYWKLGRRIEARFQWIRARENDEDQTLTAQLEQKLEKGLPDVAGLPKAQAVVENKVKPEAKENQP
ncbi:MAG TPA: tetratricopeptide repeat protein, partial [Alphaproteobacteria bacterium]|nr:tetratricopeptide repeat protein [Alphaproteobacteria bacterium]